MTPRLGYWGTRGLGQRVRFLAYYIGEPFEDHRYELKSGVSVDELLAEWSSDKNSLGLQFPNLPYWIDGDLKLTQSLVIMRYLGRKHGLLPKNEADQLRVELAEQQFNDMHLALFQLLTAEPFEEKRAEHIKNLPGQLNKISKFFGDRPFVAGDYITYVDFLAYEVLDVLKLWSPESFEDFENISGFLERIEALPRLKEYLESPNYSRVKVSSPSFPNWGWPKD